MRNFDHASLEPIRYYECPFDHQQAILLVDSRTETVPITDALGNKHYYCPTCLRTFSVGEHESVTVKENDWKKLA